MLHLIANKQHSLKYKKAFKVSVLSPGSYIGGFFFSTLFNKEVFFAYIEKYRVWEQHVYNMFTLFCLKYFFTRKLVLYFHIFLLWFRFFCESSFAKLEKHMPIQVWALLVSFVFARLKLSGVMLVAYFIVLRLDYEVVKVARFYKTYPHLFLKHFPQAAVASHSHRHMWTHAANTLKEAASNPNVQAAGTIVVGALAWKALDVYDTLKAGETADKDRVSTEESSRLDREKAAESAHLDREKAAESSRLDRDSAAQSSRLDREAETKRWAFEQQALESFQSLPEDQKEKIIQGGRTGIL